MTLTEKSKSYKVEFYESFAFMDYFKLIVFHSLFPSGVEMTQHRLNKGSMHGESYVRETQFRKFYIDQIDDFVKQMYAIISTDPSNFTKLLCLDGIRRPPYIVDHAPIDQFE